MPRQMLGVLVSIGFVFWSGCSERKPPEVDRDEAAEHDPRAPFVGNWVLFRVDRVSAGGELLPPPEPPAFGSEGAVGYLMYHPSGYMGVTIMQPGRQPYSGEEPTPEEAEAALSSYTSYFGTYTVNEANGAVTHHLQGNLRPSASSADYERRYELSGDQLTLMPPVGESGIQYEIVWQRVPDLPEEELTETHRRLFGFYRIRKIERWTVEGEPVPVDQFDEAFIIYMPSGHMAVHIVRPNRPTYSGAPTPEQALEAVRTYGSYFGPFSVHEEEGYLVHHRIGNLDPGQSGTDAQRFYELTDDTVTLKPPPRIIDGRELQTALTWERLP